MARPHRSRRAASRVWHQILETIRTVFYAALVAIVIRTLLFEPFNIPSGSMIPTLQVGDLLFVAKYSYGYSRFSLPFSPPLFSGRIFGSLPRRGDVVVFRYPRDTSEDYIKRVVGLPGDHIQMREGVLYVNGIEATRTPIGPYEADDQGRKTLEEEFSEHLPGAPAHDILKATDEGWVNNTQIYVVPNDTFFAMGDNRDDSADSRFADGVGYVPLENLVGKAEFIFFSWDSDAARIRWDRIFKVIR